MTEELVKYNGIEMIAGWPAAIETAQDQPDYLISGKSYPRIRYGGESARQPNPNCRDCAVMVGQFHVTGCLVERCPACGGQAYGCECENQTVKNLARQ